MRGARSAAFIIGSLLAGVAISTYGLWVIIALHAVLMLFVPLAVRLVPPVTVPADDTAKTISREDIAELLRLSVFRRVVLVAALILGSHAMHDTFAVIRWTGAGISPSVASILWSASVAAESSYFLGRALAAARAHAGRSHCARCSGRRCPLAGGGFHGRHYGIVPDAASARHHVRLAAPCLHAATGGQRAGPLRSNGTSDLRYCRRRLGHGVPDADFRMALRAHGPGGLCHHEPSVPGGTAPGSAPERPRATSRVKLRGTLAIVRVSDDCARFALP